MSRRAAGSMPAVGSSRITTLECPMSATAMDSFRFMPPDKCLAKVSVLDTMFIRTSRLNVCSWTSLYGTFFSLEKK